MRSTYGFIALAALVGFFAWISLGTEGLLSLVQPGCDVKGNISFNTGERIYHVPGGRFYDATRINLAKGERWFCNEREARAAGWRQSKR